MVYEPNMEDYLLCHAAFVMPAAFACYKTDGNLKKLKGDAAYLNRLIDAGIDEMSALNRDLKLFFGENGADYTTWRELEREAAKYLK